MKRIWNLIAEETDGFDWKWTLAQIMMGLIPVYVANRVRTNIMRIMGFRLGKGTVVFGPPTLTGGKKPHERLSAGRDCIISVDCLFDLAAPVTIGNRVAIGPRSILLTGAHSLGSSDCRMGPLTPMPITVCDGAWLGAGVLIMPGVTIGPGAVAAAGSVVTRDVPPNVLVAGVPAAFKRDLIDRPA